jgi:hypothetical protein
LGCIVLQSVLQMALPKAPRCRQPLQVELLHRLLAPALVDQYSGFAGLASFFKLHMPCGHLPVGVQPAVGPQGPKLLTAARLYQLSAGSVGLPLTGVCTAAEACIHTQQMRRDAGN